MMHTDEFIQNLIKMSLASREREINCEECGNELDRYVDLLLEGEDPTRLMPLIEQHLSVCSCCHSEYEALLLAVKSATGSDKP